MPKKRKVGTAAKEGTPISGGDLVAEVKIEDSVESTSTKKEELGGGGDEEENGKVACTRTLRPRKSTCYNMEAKIESPDELEEKAPVKIPRRKRRRPAAPEEDKKASEEPSTASTTSNQVPTPSKEDCSSSKDDTNVANNSEVADAPKDEKATTEVPIAPPPARKKPTFRGRKFKSAKVNAEETKEDSRKEKNVDPERQGDGGGGVENAEGPDKLEEKAPVKVPKRKRRQLTEEDKKASEEPSTSASKTATLNNEDKGSSSPKDDVTSSEVTDASKDENTTEALTAPAAPPPRKPRKPKSLSAKTGGKKEVSNKEEIDSEQRVECPNELEAEEKAPVPVKIPRRKRRRPATTEEDKKAPEEPSTSASASTKIPPTPISTTPNEEDNSSSKEDTTSKVAEDAPKDENNTTTEAAAAPAPPPRKPGFRGRKSKSLSSKTGGRKEVFHREEEIDPEELRGFEHVERYVAPPGIRLPKFWDSEDELSDDDTSDNYRRIMCGFGTNCRIHEVIRPASEIVRRLKELQNTFGTSKTIPLFPNVQPEPEPQSRSADQESFAESHPIRWHNDPWYFNFANNYP